VFSFCFVISLPWGSHFFSFIIYLFFFCYRVGYLRSHTEAPNDDWHDHQSITDQIVTTSAAESSASSEAGIDSNQLCGNIVHRPQTVMFSA
jgi:hypothetical protein